MSALSSRWLLACCLALALLGGCASRLDLARRDYDRARYPEALARYRAEQRSLSRLPPAQLFEYALYRGLSHLALGDAGPAEHWLLLAKRMLERTPGLATPEQQGRLLSAWRSMGHMPGD